MRSVVRFCLALCVLALGWAAFAQVKGGPLASVGVWNAYEWDLEAPNGFVYEAIYVEGSATVLIPPPGMASFVSVSIVPVGPTIDFLSADYIIGWTAPFTFDWSIELFAAAPGVDGAPYYPINWPPGVYTFKPFICLVNGANNLCVGSWYGAEFTVVILP